MVLSPLTQKVFKKIPRNVQNEEDPQEQAWTKAIIDHLEKLKDSAGAPPKRGKKVNIVFGKSISVGDLTIKSLTDPEEPQSVIAESPENSDSEDNRVESSLPGTSQDQDISDNSLEIRPEDSHSKNIHVEDFIIAKFPTKKRERWLIGKVENMSEEEWTLNVLRKKEKGYFVYPEIQDLSLIDYTQFHKKIKVKYVKRGKHVFALTEEELQILE